MLKSLILTCVPKHEPPPPSSLPTTSLWVIPMHQPQACCTLRQTWTGENPGFDKGKTAGMFGLTLYDLASFISLYVKVKV